MDELIYNLRRLSEWTAKELWENPVNFPEGVLKQAADELEKAREIVVLWDMYGGSEGITDAFERAEKARWIPVEERLPENHELVIWWLVPSIGQKYGFAFPSTFDEKKGMPEAATHWMALTEGPREESNGNQC